MSVLIIVIFRFIFTLTQVISLAATYGLYFVSSFMHFEPYVLFTITIKCVLIAGVRWHMFTSFIQYMFLLPTCEPLSLLGTVSDCDLSRC